MPSKARQSDAEADRRALMEKLDDLERHLQARRVAPGDAPPLPAAPRGMYDDFPPPPGAPLPELPPSGEEHWTRREFRPTPLEFAQDVGHMFFGFPLPVTVAGVNLKGLTPPEAIMNVGEALITKKRGGPEERGIRQYVKYNAQRIAQSPKGRKFR